MKKLAVLFVVLCLLWVAGCQKTNAPEEQARALLETLQSIPAEELQFVLKHVPVTPDAPRALVSPGREGAAAAQSGTVVYTAGADEHELVQTLIGSMKLKSVEPQSKQLLSPGTSFPRLSVFDGDNRQNAAYFRMITAGQNDWGHLECELQIDEKTWTAAYTVDNAALGRLHDILWAG